MENIESALFYIVTAIHTIVYIFFIVGPFKNKYRFSTPKTIIVICLYILATLALFKFGYDRTQLIPELALIPLLIWIAVTIGACFLCIKANPLELLFSLLVIFNVQAYVVVCSKVCRYLFIMSNEPSWYFDGFRYISGSVIFFGIFVPMMWYLFMNLLRKVVNLKIEFRYWKYLWIVPLLFLIGTYVSDFWGIGESGTFVFHDLFILIIMKSFACATYILCLKMLIKTHENLTVKEKAHIMEKQLEIQKVEYLKLTESISNNQHRLHDWRHHIMVINGFVKEKNYDKLEEYLKNYMAKELKVDEVPLCAHHTVNIMLKHFTGIAKEEKIKVNCNVNIPEDINIPDSELCIIFGNILENALDACKTCTQTQKLLDINVQTKGKQLIIIVQNTFEGVLKYHDGIYYSTKHEGEGIGLSSIQSIVSKSDGNFKICSKDNLFKVNILINF